ncbi:hypothetical protein PSTG_08321 [Puccinia striiformis f. sp. tritici PST-78]|uniref:Uncharacterized protein n=1 Tax=Puccinia striiformis f. sp. tritici PST-78 TaxID=1165861 RepID=A0A0L0VGI5_9BASI|nr:hypothetical protein PSTG_08321 [Puccinia striiformis f. sp. tritici PST-78]
MLLKSLLLIEIIQLALPILGTPLGRIVQRSSMGSISSVHRAQPNHFIKRAVIEELEAASEAKSTSQTSENSKRLRLLPIEPSSRDTSKGGGTVNKKPTAYKSTWDATPSSSRATSSRYKTISSSHAKYASSGLELEPRPQVIDAILGPERQQVRSKKNSLQDNLFDGSGTSLLDLLMNSVRRLKNKLSNHSIAEKKPERVKLASPSTTRGD